MKAINKDKLLAYRFAPMPEIVRVSPILSSGAKILYNQIVSYFWQKEDIVAWPSQQELANKLSISVRNIRYYLDELKKVQLLEVKRLGLGKTNNIYLLEPQAKLLGVVKTKNGSYQPREVKGNVPIQGELEESFIDNPVEDIGQQTHHTKRAGSAPALSTQRAKKQVKAVVQLKPQPIPPTPHKQPPPKRTKEELLSLLTALDYQSGINPITTGGENEHENRN